MSNIQNYVIILSDPKGNVWPVGTNTLRGFTENGANRAVGWIDEHLPYGWVARAVKLNPINAVLAAEQR